MKFNAFIIALAAGALAAPAAQPNTYDITDLSTEGQNVAKQIAALDLKDMSADQIKQKIQEFVTEDVPANEVKEMEDAVDSAFGINKRGETSAASPLIKKDGYCCENCECLTSGCSIM